MWDYTAGYQVYYNTPWHKSKKYTGSIYTAKLPSANNHIYTKLLYFCYTDISDNLPQMCTPTQCTVLFIPHFFAAQICSVCSQLTPTTHKNIVNATHENNMKPKQPMKGRTCPSENRQLYAFIYQASELGLWIRTEQTLVFTARLNKPHKTASNHVDYQGIG